MNRRPLIVAALFLALFGSVRIGQRFMIEKPLWLNFTHSEAVGLYRLQRFDGVLRRGDMVIIEVPAAYRGYIYGRRWLPEGWTMLKHVGAVPGDVFCVADVLSINGKTIGPVYRTDAEGLPLPFRPGCFRISPGCFLPVATGIPRSFDGRYMGELPQSLIRGIVHPIITF